MNKKFLLKIILTIVALLVFGLSIVVLTHPAKNSLKTKEILPVLDTRNIYVELGENEPLTVNITPSASMNISGLELLLLNLSEAGSGSIALNVYAGEPSEETLVAETGLNEADVVVGSWQKLAVSFFMEKGQEYTFEVISKGCEPYFAQVTPKALERLPFKENVAGYDCGISLGFDEVENRVLTYGDIFYHSLPLCVLFVVIFMLFIWLEPKKFVLSFNLFVSKAGDLISRIGSDAFLVIVFVYLCFNLYSASYHNGVCISADSGGYLREAVALVNGQGFSYDGLAGYNSWFANWPIIYPGLIALSMLLTHVNAYLASRFLGMLLIAVILLVLRFTFKRDAWAYSLCLLNLGFMEISNYTWSELPFIIFLLGFCLILGKILEKELVSVKEYVGLGLMITGAFLTRYFGIFLFFVVAIYLFIMFIVLMGRKNGKFENILENRISWNKFWGIGLSTFVSGIVYLSYMFMNKKMNGMASGVSRTMWWDDLETLTEDLVNSLTKEVFNAFAIEIPQTIRSLDAGLKVFILLLVIVIIGCLVKYRLRPFSLSSVMITMSVVYYTMFTVIRYFSSMDTFYFRFWEPASFILGLGIISLILPDIKGKKPLYAFVALVFLGLILNSVQIIQNGELSLDDTYYDLVAASWDEVYDEIPDHSVVIFSDLDYRSVWYRPDVVEGTVTPEDSVAAIKNRYYGSEYICIRRDYADAMLESGEYQSDFNELLLQGLATALDEDVYISVSLVE